MMASCYAASCSKTRTKLRRGTDTYINHRLKAEFQCPAYFVFILILGRKIRSPFQLETISLHVILFFFFFLADITYILTVLLSIFFSPILVLPFPSFLNERGLKSTNGMTLTGKRTRHFLSQMANGQAATLGNIPTCGASCLTLEAIFSLIFLFWGLGKISSLVFPNW